MPVLRCSMSSVQRGQRLSAPSTSMARSTARMGAKDAMAGAVQAAPAPPRGGGAPQSALRRSESPALATPPWSMKSWRGGGGTAVVGFGVLVVARVGHPAMVDEVVARRGEYVDQQMAARADAFAGVHQQHRHRDHRRGGRVQMFIRAPLIGIASPVDAQVVHEIA